MPATCAQDIADRLAFLASPAASPSPPAPFLFPDPESVRRLAFFVAALPGAASWIRPRLDLIDCLADFHGWSAQVRGVQLWRNAIDWLALFAFCGRRYGWSGKRVRSSTPETLLALIATEPANEPTPSRC